MNQPFTRSSNAALVLSIAHNLCRERASLASLPVKLEMYKLQVDSTAPLESKHKQRARLQAVTADRSLLLSAPLDSRGCCESPALPAPAATRAAAAAAESAALTQSATQSASRCAATAAATRASTRGTSALRSRSRSRVSRPHPRRASSLLFS